MNDEQTFRLILLAGFVIFMPIGVYHRLKSRTNEKLDRRQEGLFILVTLRLTGLAAMAGWVTYLVNPVRMAWAAVPLPAWLRWTGVGLALCAGLLIIWTFRNLGRNLTDTVVTRKEHTLITTGPYRWGAASLILRGGAGVPRKLPRRGQRVSLRHRLHGGPVARDPHPEGRSEPPRPVRRRLSELHAAHRPVRAPSVTVIESPDAGEALHRFVSSARPVMMRAPRL